MSENTNYLLELHKEHKARQQRIKDAAYIPPAHEPRKRGGNTIDIIIEEVCEYYGVSKSDFLSQRRLNNLAKTRQITCYMVFRLTSFTNPQIAEKMNRDPSTVGYSIKKIQEELEEHQKDIDWMELHIGEILKDRKREAP